jgi:ATP/maltotriose-dependent transcriptional regulator MalT
VFPLAGSSIPSRAWIATSGIITEAVDGVLRAGDLEMTLADVIEQHLGAMLTGR